MKKKKVVALVLAMVIVLSSVSMTVIAVAGDWQPTEWITNAWTNKTDGDNSVVKYEKPSIGEIAGDGEYPDEVSANSSDYGKEKPWYQYITYSTKPVTEVTIDSNTKVLLYDPYDYSYGLIMDVEDTIYAPDLSPGINLDSYIKLNSTFKDTFRSANSKTIAYSVSVSKTEGTSEHLDFEFEEEFKTEIPFLGGFTLKTKQAFGFSWDYSNTSSADTSISETYNAIYFNSDGVPCQWKIVHYTVYLPLKCVVQKKDASGSFIDSDEEFYYLCSTIQGTCREYIKNNATFIEHWGTGEAVPVENFWKSFFTTSGTRDGVKDAYQNRLTPTN